MLCVVVFVVCLCVLLCVVVLCDVVLLCPTHLATHSTYRLYSAGIAIESPRTPVGDYDALGDRESPATPMAACPVSDAPGSPLPTQPYPRCDPGDGDDGHEPGRATELNQTIGLVWSGILCDANTFCDDGYDMSLTMGPVVHAMHFLMDDLVHGAPDFRERLQGTLAHVLPADISFLDKKHRLWNYLYFLSDVSDTFGYMRSDTDAFHVALAAPTMAWVTKPYLMSPGQHMLQATQTLDDNIRRLLATPVINVD